MMLQPRGASRGRHALACLYAAAIAFVLVLGGPVSLDAQSGHPLDPLSWDEHWTLLEVLREAGRLDNLTGVSFVTLAPPDKDAVWRWQRGQTLPRAAFAVLKQGPQTYEAVVDPRARKLTSWKEATGVQPNFLEREFDLAGKIALDNAEVRAALERLGYRDLSDIYCFGVPPGYFGTDQQMGRRLANVECYDMRRARGFPWTRGVGGLTVVVDVNAGEVLEVIDDGVVPMPPNDFRYDESVVESLRDKGAPIAVQLPRLG